MVHASMDVDVYDVSIHGWANNAHRSSSSLPSNFHNAISAPMPVPSRLPDRSRAPQDDIQRLRPRESMVVAAPREKNSFHPQAPQQEEEAERAFDKEATIKSRLRTYLFPIKVSVFRVGCHVEGWLRELLTSHRPRKLPSFPQPTFTALSSAIDRTRTIQFDSDSYPIGIDTHALRCMVNAPHLFEDLKLGKVGEVEGIKSGLDIKGMGTFKFKIKDDSGMMHKIKIPNSLYVPELKRCLLSPQHRVQEAKDNYSRPKGTRMSQDNECYCIYWDQVKFKKLIPYDPSTNVPILYTAALLRAYRALATTFEATEAPFF